MLNVVGRSTAGSFLKIEFDGALLAVDDLLQPETSEVFVAPGFIDLQVNGFAGVDYNDPASSHDTIARQSKRCTAPG